MTVAEILGQHGISRPAEVAELAQATGLELACAAAMLEKESGGGLNVWGHDAVNTAGAYVPGAEVTQDSYSRYRAAVLAGKAGRQGCGPAQITYGPFQDAADARGGCWNWRVNCAVGFEILAGYIHAVGVHDGFGQYNGGSNWRSFPAAVKYAADGAARTEAWRQSLNGGGTDLANVSDVEKARLLEGAAAVLFGKAGVRSAGDLALVVDEIRNRQRSIEAKLDQLLAKG